MSIVLLIYYSIKIYNQVYINISLWIYVILWWQYETISNRRPNVPEFPDPIGKKPFFNNIIPKILNYIIFISTIKPRDGIYNFTIHNLAVRNFVYIKKCVLRHTHIILLYVYTIFSPRATNHYNVWIMQSKSLGLSTLTLYNILVYTYKL